MQYYDDSKNSQGRIACKNEAEFRAYMVVFQVHNRTPDLEERVNNWDLPVKSSMQVRTAMDIYAAACNVLDLQGPFKPFIPHPVAREDWNRFFTLVQSRQTSYLMACVSEIYFNLTRTAILNAVWQAFKPQGSKLELSDFTLELLTDMFGFDFEEQTQDFCQRHGFSFKENAQGELFLNLNSVKGRSLPVPIPALSRQTFSERLVESKRAGRTLPAVINGLSIVDSHRDGLIEEGAEDSPMEEEDDSIFIPQDTTKTTAPTSVLGPSLFDPPASSTPSPFANPTEKVAGFGLPSSANVPATSEPPATSVFGQPFSSQAQSQTQLIFAQPPATTSSNPFAAAPSQSPFSIAPAQSPFSTAPSQSPFSVGPSQSPFSAAPSQSPFSTKPAQSPFSSFVQPPAASSPESTEANLSTKPSSIFGQPPAPKFGGSGNASSPETGGVTVTSGDSTSFSEGLQARTVSPFAAIKTTSDTATGPNLTGFSFAAPSSGSKPSVPGFSFASKPAGPSPVDSPSTSLFFTNQPSSDRPATVQSSTPKSPSFSSASDQLPLPQGPPVKVNEASNQLPKGLGAGQAPVLDQQGKPQSATESPTSVLNSPAPSVSSKAPTLPQARRPSFGFSSQPKKPSPLSQSFTAHDTNGHSPQSPQAVSTQQPPPLNDSSFSGLKTAKPSDTMALSSTPLSSPKPQPQVRSKADILEDLAHEVIADYNTGLIRQFVEYHARTTVMEIWNQLQLENLQELADDFRRETLRYRYGRMWRDICWRLRLVRQGKEKRRKAKRTQETRELRKRLAAESNAVDEFLKSTHEKQLGKSTSRHLVRPSVEAPSNGVSTGSSSKRPASSNGSDGVAFGQGASHKRLKSVDHVDESGRIVKPRASTSRDSTPASRASYLTFSVLGARGENSVPVSSTRSNYFRLKALGINPGGNTTGSMAKKRTRDHSEETDREVAPPAKKSRTPPRTNTEVIGLQQSGSPAYSPNAHGAQLGRLSPGSSKKPLSAAQHEDEALFARARAARQAMADTAAWYRSELQKDESQRIEESARPIDTASMQRARQEAQFRASQSTSIIGGASQDLPAYRLRESRFVPRDRYGQAIERARSVIEARSVSGQNTPDLEPTGVRGSATRTVGDKIAQASRRSQEQSTGSPRASAWTTKQQPAPSSTSKFMQQLSSSQFSNFASGNIGADTNHAQQSYGPYNMHSSTATDSNNGVETAKMFGLPQTGLLSSAFSGDFSNDQLAADDVATHVISTKASQKPEGRNGFNPFAVLNGYEDDDTQKNDPPMVDNSAADPTLSEEPMFVDSEIDQEAAIEGDLALGYTEAEPEGTHSERSDNDESDGVVDEEVLDENEEEDYEEEDQEVDFAQAADGLEEEYDEGEDYDEEEDSEGFDESEEDYDEDDVHYPALPQGEMQSGNSVIKAGTGTAEDAFELSD